MGRKESTPELQVEMPDHTAELTKAEEMIEVLKIRFKVIQHDKSIDQKIHTSMYEETVRLLDYVARLSEAAFRVEDDLEQQYISKYKHTPALCKRLFWQHYERLHKPYSLLKNRCFRLLEDLDEEFKKRHKKNPPNWNI